MNETAVAYQHILVEVAERIATVTMNRPEKRNALSIEHMHELTACLRAIGEVRRRQASHTTHAARCRTPRARTSR